jgi:hypothetical protein
MHVPKVISDNAILGQLEVNFVEKILLNVLHTTNSLEAGIDFFIELRDRATGAASNFFIAVQIKATQQEFLKETPSTFEWVCTQRDLDYWLQGNAPVVLIIVRPRTEEVYWVPIKEYFRDLSKKAKHRIIFRSGRLTTCAPGASSRVRQICRKLSMLMWVKNLPTSRELALVMSETLKGSSRLRTRD